MSLMGCFGNIVLFEKLMEQRWKADRDKKDYSERCKVVSKTPFYDHVKRTTSGHKSLERK